MNGNNAHVILLHVHLLNSIIMAIVLW